MNEFLLLLSRVPAEAFPAMGRVLSAMLAGDHEAAALEARLASETIAIKRATHAAFQAGAAHKVPGTGE